MSCSQTAAKEPAGASSSRARSGSQSWKARKKLQEQEGAKGEGGGGGGRWPAAVSVFGDVREDELHRLPDRLFLNGATEAACLYTQQGKKGTNQDAMIVWKVPGFNPMHVVKNFSPLLFALGLWGLTAKAWILVGNGFWVNESLFLLSHACIWTLLFALIQIFYMVNSVLFKVLFSSL